MKIRKRHFSVAALGAAAMILLTAGCETIPYPLNPDGPVETVHFTVRIENISDGSVLLAPGIWLLHTTDAPLFSDGGMGVLGLEPLAEDGNPNPLTGLNPSGLAIHLDADPGILYGGAFRVPVGAHDPAPIGKGEAYEFTFPAVYGSKLTFATMFVQSNDLFYAPSEMGIELFDEKYAVPLKGDITDKVMLWDAGTEVNEEPGVGPNQAPRQAGPNTGEAENGVVHLVNDGYDYPAVKDAIRVTIMNDKLNPDNY